MSGKLFLGIDLGTSQTAVMTSRGKKLLLKSVVGYPRDVIGLKLLGRAYVVGDEAYEMRSYLELRYPLQDGVLSELSERDLQVARHLLTHVIGLAEPAEGDEIYAVIGVPARASGGNKALLLKMAHEVVNTALVVSEPFMVAYGLDKLINTIVVDIGAGTTDLCALKGNVPSPDDQVTVTKAGKDIDERLQNALIERYPELQINPNVARSVKEAFSFVGAPPAPAIAEFRAGGKPVQCDVTECVQVACESVMPDILWKASKACCRPSSRNIKARCCKTLSLLAVARASGVSGLISKKSCVPTVRPKSLASAIPHSTAAVGLCVWRKNFLRNIGASWAMLQVADRVKGLAT